MNHTIIISGDGSNTLKLTDYDESYHSVNGAFSEAAHIYIKNGIEYAYSNIPDETSFEINVYDIGLGTGLNLLLTLVWQQELALNNLKVPLITYYGIEKYPISLDEIQKLNYPQIVFEHYNDLCNPLIFRNTPLKKLSIDTIKELFFKVHSAEWEEPVNIAHNFTLYKHNNDILNVKSSFFSNSLHSSNISIIYYDTFSPATQPQLWNEQIFSDIYNGINFQSILVTYCSKGIVKQAIRNAGFVLERLSGPKGKRHIIRAYKSKQQ